MQFVVLEQIVPPELIEAAHDAFIPLLRDVQARDPGPVSVYTEETGDPHSGMGRMQQAGSERADGAHRYTLTIPWVRPFAHPQLYENPVVLAFLDVRKAPRPLPTQHTTTPIPPVLPPDPPPPVVPPHPLRLCQAYWETQDYHITNYHSNNPCPGAVTQHWHRDTSVGRDLPFQSLATCPCVGVKFPLVDTSEANGSIEVLPCTQYLADPSMEVGLNVAINPQL